MKSPYLLPFVAVLFLNGAAAQSAHPSPSGAGSSHSIHLPGEMKWQDGPASLSPGVKFAVLEGDPTKEGPFTMRLRLPAGFKIMPHTHPATEHVTVISGTFNFGMGDKFDEAATQAMPAGTFGHWIPGMKHFAWAKGETIIQLHGIGPWKIEYVNPADDPRKAKETKTK